MCSFVQRSLPPVRNSPSLLALSAITSQNKMEKIVGVEGAMFQDVPMMKTRESSGEVYF